MGYKLFSDVTADVSEELMRGMPEVELVPMQVELGGENYIYGPGGDLTVEHFYAEQRAGKFASTSQINPMVYRECFEKTLKAGEDILYLCFSSGLSSTLQSANLCAQELREEYPERKLIVVDTLCAAVGEAMLVREAARKQQEGLTIEELAANAGIDAEGLAATVEAYNGYVAAGEDKDFGREADTMVALEGPFYAVKTCPYVMLTKGGPLMNPDAQTLNADGEPIPGLYQCGELAGGANIGGSANIGGLANTSCIVWGKIAGANAAAYALGK